MPFYAELTKYRLQRLRVKYVQNYFSTVPSAGGITNYRAPWCDGWNFHCRTEQTKGSCVFNQL